MLLQSAQCTPTRGSRCWPINNVLIDTSSMTTHPGTLLCVSFCYAAVAIAATFGNLYGIVKISVMCKVSMTTHPGTLLCVSFCYAAVAIAATFGNLYGIVKISVMCKMANDRDKTSLRKTNLHLLLHMCLSDMLTGALAAPFTVITLVIQASGNTNPDIPWLHRYMCNVSGFVQCTTCRMSLLVTMLLVTIRALAIYSPKKGKEPSCHMVILSGDLMGWWDIDEIFGENGFITGYLLVDTIPFFIPGSVVLIGTAAVLSGLKRIQRQSDVRRRSQVTAMASGTTAAVLPPRAPSGKRVHCHYQAAITTLLVAALFLVSYGMWWITSVITLLAED
eukprot:sb/3466575/